MTNRFFALTLAAVATMAALPAHAQGLRAAPPSGISLAPGMARPAGPRQADYIVAVVNRVRENLAELYVLDTRDWLGDPVARVRLPFNLPMSFHGCFVARTGAQLPR